MVLKQKELKKEKLTMFTDLDGTLIDSSNKTPREVCVATKNNKPSSFISENTYKKFSKLKNMINIVPVTTRCKLSYENVKITKDMEYALVDNGAILLHNNIVDEEWLDESYKLSKISRNNFNKCREILEKYGYIEKWGSDFVLDYVNKNISLKDKENMKSELIDYCDGLRIKINNTSAVILFDRLSKGENIRRYIKKFNVEPLISAGDTSEDETMFLYTTYSIGNNLSSATYNNKDRNMIDYVVEKSIEIINNL